MNLRRWLKWALGLGAAAALVAIIAGKLYFGSASELEQWIGRQVVAIVNTFLVPQLSFTDLDYTAPTAVSLKKAALTAPDGTKVLDLDGFDFSLAETPSLDKPIVVEKIAIERGRINLIRDEKSGGLRGLSPIIKSSDTSAPIRADGQSPAVFRLSDVLHLRLVDLRDVGVRYDPGGGRPPMQIDGITTQLKLDPGGAAAEAGWYKFDFTIDRGTNLHLILRGRINLDTGIAELDEGRITLQVGPQSLSTLPSDLQAILKEYDAQGELDIRLRGRIPLSDPLSGNVSMQVALKNFRLVLAPRRLIIDSLTMDVAMAERKVELKSLAARLLKGDLTAQARVDLAATDRPAVAQWTIKDLDLAEWRSDSATSDQGLKGRVSSSGKVEASLARLPASLSGAGDMHIRDGRLVGLPLISALADVMKINIPSVMAPADKADATFKFTPPGVRIERLDIVTGLLAARGDGLVRYDGTLDLRVSAGPLEKLQSLLGKAGDLLSLVTDKLVTYKVEGRLGNPTVRIMVLDQKLGG
ncbi:MAG TPA: DUF3971 domain-containing protein [Phycisphaerae bacterium]|nr:DUF3971 domain-containing protein [Phycisphaerae bacterium]